MFNHHWCMVQTWSIVLRCTLTCLRRNKIKQNTPFTQKLLYFSLVSLQQVSDQLGSYQDLSSTKIRSMWRLNRANNKKQSHVKNLKIFFFFALIKGPDTCYVFNNFTAKSLEDETSIYLINGYLEAMASAIIHKKPNIKILYN